MFAHDQQHIFYVVSGDRIFTIALRDLHEGYRRAVAQGTAEGACPAGESPLAADTGVVELAEMILREDGSQRGLVPVDLTSDTALVLAVAGPAELTRSALMLWADYCDAAADRMDRGLAAEDALRLAGGPDADAACLDDADARRLAA